jgi:adenylosuccinate synthase
MQLHVIVGGQFGSEGKGALAGALFRRFGATGPWAAVRVAGPNAGHTVYTLAGERVVTRTIPAAVAVTGPEVPLVIGPGSEVDLFVLLAEIDMLDIADLRASERVFIHEQATLLESHHAELEGGNDGPLQRRLGSTGKGVGAARAARIMREARIMRDLDPLEAHHVPPVIDDWEYHDLLLDRHVMVEGTQGYGLGLHAGYYPFCTSSDCVASDFLSMAGLSPWAYDVTVWVVIRTFPIRVAGNSGPLAAETTWEALAAQTGGYVKPELTTVTRKVRRVAEFDPLLVCRALNANGRRVCRVALMFLDYIDPECAGVTEETMLTDRAWEFIKRVEGDIDAEVSFVGTGPYSGAWLR